MASYDEIGNKIPVFKCEIHGDVFDSICVMCEPDYPLDGTCNYCDGNGCVACDASKTIIPKLTYKEKYLLLTEQYARDIENSILISELEQVKFPTSLRKMWSGGEVQEWLDREIQRLIAAEK